MPTPDHLIAKTLEEYDMCWETGTNPHPPPTPGASLAKAKVRRVIKKIAEYGVTTAGHCWMVHDELLQKHDLAELPLQNEWVWKTQENVATKRKSATSNAGTPKRKVTSNDGTPKRKKTEEKTAEGDDGQVSTPKSSKKKKTSLVEGITALPTPESPAAPSTNKSNTTECSTNDSSTNKSSTPKNNTNKSVAGKKTAKTPRRVAITTITPATPKTGSEDVTCEAGKSDVSEDCVVTSVTVPKKEKIKEKAEQEKKSENAPDKPVVIELDTPEKKRNGKQVSEAGGDKEEVEKMVENAKESVNAVENVETKKSFEKSDAKDVAANNEGVTKQNPEADKIAEKTNEIKVDLVEKENKKVEKLSETVEEPPKKTKEKKAVKVESKKPENDVAGTPPSAKKRKLTPGKQTPSPLTASGKKGKEKRQTTLEQMFAKSFKSAKKLDVSKDERAAKTKNKSSANGTKDTPMEIE